MEVLGDIFASACCGCSFSVTRNILQAGAFETGHAARVNVKKQA